MRYSEVALGKPRNKEARRVFRVPALHGAPRIVLVVSVCRNISLFVGFGDLHRSAFHSRNLDPLLRDGVDFCSANLLLVVPALSGIPTFYGALLFKNRKTLRDSGAMGRELANNFPTVGHLVFLVDSYKRACLQSNLCPVRRSVSRSDLPPPCCSYWPHAGSSAEFFYFEVALLLPLL